MINYCLDFCSLLNLYCGWGGINELHVFGGSWSISDKAFNEFSYVRTLQPDGSKQNTSVSHAEILSQYPLSIHSVSGAAELATLLLLTAKIDDGEAASLAIAKHRGLVFVSDDGPAIKAANYLSVPTASSLELLIRWAGSDVKRRAALPAIVQRIAVLASFIPSKSSPHRAWWEDMQPPTSFS
jgi:predicted nucleic acid-binding protein